jgi:hypothetical protein
VPAELRPQLIQQHPELIGNRDGIPVTARDQANRILIGRQREALVAERTRLEGQLLDDHSPGGKSLNPAIRSQIDRINGKISGIDAINARLDSQPTVSRDADGFFLLGVDPSSEGRFIVARGNPDTAKNVATFVPGSLTDLSQADGLLNQGDALHRAAVRAGSPQIADGPSTSVITWLDYDSPDSIPGAIWPGKAEDGAARLVSFQEGLRTTHAPGPPAHTTVVGHSYGSTVAGFAASQGRTLAADEIIGAGSPGFGVDTADQLSVGKEHVWVVESPHDPIADTSVFGADPSENGFGARVYNSEPGPPVGSAIPSTSGYSPYSPGNKLPQYDYTVAAHDSYLREPPGGNAGLDTMGQIIAGNNPPPR